MKIRNNSEHEWLDYNCGDGFKVTIEPKSEFTVPDRIGNFLLRVLGHPNWLVKVDDESPAPAGDVVVEEPKESEQPEEPSKEDATEEFGEESKEDKTEDTKEDKPYCEFCTSKGGRHKEDCTKPKE